jgi:hypothetical protein
LQLLNTVSLIAIATLLAAGNIWCAAARSLIPLALNDRVDRIELRREKHPGKDDVYLIALHGGSVLQIDQPVAEAMAIGSSVKKDAWSRTIQVDSRVVDLSWSADFQGMIKAMPAILAVVVAAAAWAGRRPPTSALEV